MYSMYPSFIICKKNRQKKEKKSLQLSVECFFEIGPSKHNRCTKQSKATNLQKTFDGIYKDKESPEGESISLSGQRGRPVPVTLGLQQKPTLDKITVEYLFVW